MSLLMLLCSLGMFAVGGMAWGLGWLPGRRVERLAGTASRASCLLLRDAKRQPSEAGETTPSASVEADVPAHV